MRRRSQWSAAALGGVLLFVAFSACAAEGGGAPLKVVITIDDIPWAGNEKLIAALKRNDIPALGLVVESRIQGHPERVKAWLDAGFELGNHTASHRDFNRTPLAEFEADTIAGEKTLRALGKPPKYFRYPFLRSGTELAKKRAFEDFLKKRGYTNAVVTIDNDEYIYAAAYARANEDDRKRIADDYVRYMESVFVFYEQLSQSTLGRQLPQILLLHDNALNADTFDRLAEMMKKRGYRFVPIAEALKDPAYSRRDAYIGARGLSWLHRWALDAKKPAPPQPEVPAWVNALSR